MTTNGAEDGNPTTDRQVTEALSRTDVQGTSPQPAVETTQGIFGSVCVNQFALYI